MSFLTTLAQKYKVTSGWQVSEILKKIRKILHTYKEKKRVTIDDYAEVKDFMARNKHAYGNLTKEEQHNLMGLFKSIKGKDVFRHNDDTDDTPP